MKLKVVFSLLVLCPFLALAGQPNWPFSDKLKIAIVYHLPITVVTKSDKISCELIEMTCLFGHYTFSIKEKVGNKLATISAEDVSHIYYNNEDILH